MKIYALHISIWPWNLINLFKYLLFIDKLSLPHTKCRSKHNSKNSNFQITTSKSIIQRELIITKLLQNRVDFQVNVQIFNLQAHSDRLHGLCRCIFPDLDPNYCTGETPYFRSGINTVDVGIWIPCSIHRTRHSPIVFLLCNWKSSVFIFGLFYWAVMKKVELNLAKCPIFKLRFKIWPFFKS